MEKRLVIALALSLLVLVGWQVMFPQPKNLPRQQPAPIVHEKTMPKESEKITPQPVFSDEEEFIFENRLYKVAFSSVGGGIKRVTLNKNPDAGVNIAYDVFNAGGPLNSIFLFYPDKPTEGLNSARYSAQKTEDGIILTGSAGNVSVEKRYYIHNSSYRIDLDITWRNLRSTEINQKYGLVSGVFIQAVPGDERFMEISASLDSAVSKHKKHSKPFEIQKYGQLSWLMLQNRYFSMVLRPFEPCSGYFAMQRQDGTVLTGSNAKEFSIKPDINITHKYGLYLGPSDLSLLKSSNLGAEAALSYGVFGSISQILISMLKFFHKIVRNWGAAILVLTFILNLALLPLTMKSYKSMQEMQVLQPKIQKLQKDLKNNPQKLQKEIMELYKKHKVNPMGGCLPMILQMPIFIALYNGLMRSIDLRGAKFLWIKDLSTTENIKMPFSLPLIGNSLNILPLLMLVAMFFQQKMSTKMTAMAQTEEQRKQQQFMTIMMTAMFGFIFYSFPSGLVLYWLANTILMTAYQAVFTKPPHNAEEIA